jgi:outer membrane protein TolC
LESLDQQLAAGQGNVSQQSVFQAEAARFGAELLAVRGERAGAQADLQRATGLAFRELRLVQPAFTPVPSTFALTQFADHRSGIRRIILARRAVASRGLDLAMADRFPEFGPGIMYSYNSLDKEAEFALTISARLPLWDQNQGPITRARGALDAANRELAAYDRVSLDRLIDGRRQQVLNLEARVNAFRNEVIPAYRTAYDASLAQFRAGQATTLQLFEVQRLRIESEEKALDYTVEALSARSQLEQLIGGKLEEVGGGTSFAVSAPAPAASARRTVAPKTITKPRRK